MKNILAIALFFLVIGSQNAQAQTAKTVELTQTKGAFEQKNLELKAGQPYVFEIKNKGVDHEVGFVLAPQNDEKKHIKAAYLKNTVTNGKTGQSNIVTLQKGTYVYFCPLNPTPTYTLIVK